MPTIKTPIIDVDADTRFAIEQMWQQADAHFQKCTDRALPQDKVAIKDIIEQIDKKYSGEDTERKRRTRKSIVVGLQHLSRWVRAAGGIAEMGFPAAKICFGAVALLLQLPGKGWRVYDAIADLLEEVNRFMPQKEILARLETKERVDPELIQSTHRLLTSFVKMMASTYEHLNSSKGRRLWNETKAGLFDDNAILEELDRFKSISKDQDKLYGYLTYEHVRYTEGKVDAANKGISGLQKGNDTVQAGVGVLIAADADRKSKDTRKEQLERVRKDLLDGEDSRAQKAMLRVIEDKCLPQTGQWIQSVEAYQTWIGCDPSSHPLLAIQGPTGTGKTHLVSTILDDLDHRIDKGERLFYAYHFFTKQDSSGRKDKSTSGDAAIISALRSMASQLIDKSDAYLKELDSIRMRKTEVKSKNMQPQAVWKDLSFDSAKGDVTYFLLLDGLDGLPERASDMLLSLSRPGIDGESREQQASRLRVLVTGKPHTGSRPATFETFRGPMLDMEQSPIKDLEMFVSKELADDHRWTGFASRYPSEAEKFRVSLPKMAHPDFIAASRRIDRVIQAIVDDIDIDEITQMMSAPLEKDQEIIAQQTLKTLNAQLKSQDIEQLNSVLQWLIYGHHSNTSSKFTIDQMEYIASRQSKKASAQSFQMKITNRGMFTSILTVDAYKDVDVVVVNPELLPTLTAMNDGDTRVVPGDEINSKPLISLDIKIRNAEIATVRRFLWDLSGRTHFDEFMFSALEDKRKTTINVNRVESRVSIIEYCLKLLSEEEHDSPTPSLMQVWALKHLPYHLCWVGENLELYPTARFPELARSLIALLTEADTTALHLIELFKVSQVWLTSWNSRAVGCILERARDEFSSELSRHEKKSLSRLLDDVDTYSFYRLITVEMGKHWLQVESTRIIPAFKWVDAFLQLIENAVEADSGDSVKGQEQIVESTVSETDSQRAILTGSEAVGQGDTQETITTEQASSSQTDVSDGQRNGPVILSEEARSDQRPDLKPHTDCSLDGEQGADTLPTVSNSTMHRRNDDINDQTSDHTGNESLSKLATTTTEPLHPEAASGLADDTAVELKDDQTNPEPSAGGAEGSYVDEDVEDASYDGEYDNGSVSTYDDETLRPGPAAQARIRRAAEWVLANLDAQDRKNEPLWYARLGKTFLFLDDHEEAISVFRQAIEEDKAIWNTREGLAVAHGWKQNFKEAAKEMETVLVELRILETEATLTKEREFYRTHRQLGCENLAKWRRSLLDLEAAAVLYEEMLTMAPDDYGACASYLVLCRRLHDFARADALLTRLQEERTGATSRLTAFFMSAADPTASYGYEFGYTYTVQTPVALAHELGRLSELLEAIGEAILSFNDQKQQRRYQVAAMELAKGYIVAVQDRSAEGATEAFSNWTDSFEAVNDADYYGSEVACFAYYLCGVYLHGQVLRARHDPSLLATFLMRLEKFTQNRYGFPHRVSTIGFLASAYVEVEQASKAKELLKNEMQDALDLLSDDEDWNDYMGFIRMTEIFGKLGNERMALNAWSFLGPTKPVTGSDATAKLSSEEEVAAVGKLPELQGPYRFHCAALCGQDYTYPDDIWCCYYCDNRCFCGPCHEKLKEGALSDVYNCHSSHKWYHVPSWPQGRFDTAVEGGVMFGGIVMSGSWNRANGKLLTKEQWLDAIRKDWGIEKPTVDSEEATNIQHREEDENIDKSVQQPDKE